MLPAEVAGIGVKDDSGDGIAEVARVVVLTSVAGPSVARQDVSAPFMIKNGADVTALTSVPDACTMYWPAVVLTFDQVHDSALESTLVARMVLWPARFLRIAAPVWRDALKTRTNWRVSWEPEYSHLNVTGVHVLMVESGSDHSNPGTGLGKVVPDNVTVGKTEAGSGTDIAFVDVDVCESELVVGTGERVCGKVGAGRLRVEDMVPRGGKRLSGRVACLG